VSIRSTKYPKTDPKSVEIFYRPKGLHKLQIEWVTLGSFDLEWDKNDRYEDRFIQLKDAPMTTSMKFKFESKDREVKKIGVQ